MKAVNAKSISTFELRLVNDEDPILPIDPSYLHFGNMPSHSYFSKIVRADLKNGLSTLKTIDANGTGVLKAADRIVLWGSLGLYDDEVSYHLRDVDDIGFLHSKLPCYFYLRKTVDMAGHSWEVTTHFCKSNHWNEACW